MIKGLYERKLSKDDIRQLFTLIDWMMRLPPDQDKQFRDELDQFEKEQEMPYVTSIERLAMKQGCDTALKAIALTLKTKFGAKGTKLMARAKKISLPDELNRLIHVIDKADTADEVRAYLTASPDS